MFPFKVVVVEIDEWGNRKLICPACGSVHKEDGLMKHIQYQSKHSDIEENRAAHQKLSELKKKNK